MTDPPPFRCRHCGAIVPSGEWHQHHVGYEGQPGLHPAVVFMLTCLAIACAVTIIAAALKPPA